MKLKLKLNKGILLVSLILVILVGMSFFQYFNERYSYASDYYVIKENCYLQKNINHPYCEEMKEMFQTEKDFNDYLKTYIEIGNPQKKFEELDVLTLNCTVVEQTMFSFLQVFSPLLTIIALIYNIHSDFSHGLLKNYFLRMKYSDYWKKNIKKILKISLLTPATLILVFILSMIITKFNFNYVESVEELSIYQEWKYNNFIIYGILICLIQFLINIVYCNIGLYCCKKNKNKLVTIFQGYIFCLFFQLFIYVSYGLFLSKILGSKNMIDVFNIAGYWFFDDWEFCIYATIFSIILMVLSFIWIKFVYKNKEEVIEESEKQIL